MIILRDISQGFLEKMVFLVNITGLFRYFYLDRDGNECGRKMFSENFSSDEDQDFAYFGKKYGEYGLVHYHINQQSCKALCKSDTDYSYSRCR